MKCKGGCFFFIFFLKDLLSDHLWIRLVVKQLVCPVHFFFRSPLDRGVHGENDDGPVGSVKAFLQRGDGVDGVMGVLTGLKAGRQGASACDFRLVSQVQLVYLLDKANFAQAPIFTLQVCQVLICQVELWANFIAL